MHKGKIIQDKEAGLSITDIAKKYQMSSSKIARILLNSIKTSRAEEVDEASAATIVTHFREGKKVSDISRSLGLTRYTINRVLSENLEAKTPLNTRDKDIIKTLLSDYQSGMSVSDISKKYNVTKPTIYNYLKRNGIQLHTDEETKKAIISLYNSKAKKVCELAAQFNVTRQTIRRFAKESMLKKGNNE